MFVVSAVLSRRFNREIYGALCQIERMYRTDGQVGQRNVQRICPYSPSVFDRKPGRNLNGGMASGQRKAKRRTSAESDTHSNSENVSYLSEIRSAYDELVSEGQFVYIATEPLGPEALEEEEEACAHCSMSVSESHGTLSRRY